MKKVIYGVGLYTIAERTYDMLYAPVLHNSREKLAFKSRYGQNTWAVVSGATNPTG